MPSAPKRRGSGAGPVIVLVVILAIIGIIAALAVVALRAEDSDDAARPSNPATSAPPAPPGDEPAATQVTAPPAVPGRVPAQDGSISWSMVAEPETQEMSVPAPDGGSIRGKVWSAEEPSSSSSGEIAVVFDLGGRPFSLEGGMRGTVTNTGGEVIDGPSPLEIDGRPGQMLIGTTNFGSIEGYMRVGAVQSGDRVIMVAYVNGTDDPADGEQAFADLVASVRLG